MLNSILMTIMAGIFIVFIYYLAYDAWKDFSKKDK
ncbi:hypothetical protein SAMN05421690_101516 [Nitrosomonas sp. Nm51]|nr:hypothetical protein SAMN05421690_101516 [Nitrosomonas sp. Nm51]